MSCGSVVAPPAWAGLKRGLLRLKGFLSPGHAFRLSGAPPYSQVKPNHTAFDNNCQIPAWEGPRLKPLISLDF